MYNKQQAYITKSFKIEVQNFAIFITLAVDFNSKKVVDACSNTSYISIHNANVIGHS